MEDSKDIQAFLQAVARGHDDQGNVLQFDLNTGKLVLVSTSNQCDWAKMASEGFFGGSFIAPPEKDKIVITPRSHDKEEVSVTTMHISCQSDTYKPVHNYGGVIVYQYDGKSEWRTANNTHCKSGYIVIQDTDRKDVKKWIGKEPGQVHGAIYRNTFGESVREKKEVVGEGFAIRKGQFTMNSGVFNNPSDSEYHDDRRRMHELSVHCVRKIVEYWKTSGPRWVRQRNFEVKQLLEGFDFDSLC